MAFDVKELNKADKKSKYIVFGYIKQAQNELSLKVIPVDITWICLAYLFESEVFVKVPDKMRITIYKSKYTITNNRGVWSTCYGKIFSLKNAGGRKWKIKINKLKYGAICIGIDKAPCQQEKTAFFDKALTTNYSYHCHGTKYESGIGQRLQNNYRYSDDDVIEMILNSVQGTLYFLKNGEKVPIHFDVKKSISYRLAIATRAFGDTFTLLSMTHFL
eukprot:482359_1